MDEELVYGWHRVVSADGVAYLSRGPLTYTTVVNRSTTHQVTFTDGTTGAVVTLPLAETAVTRIPTGRLDC